MKDPVKSRAVQIRYFHIRYNTDILAFTIIRNQYQSDISTLQMIDTFITYFVVWRVKKAASRDQTEIGIATCDIGLFFFTDIGYQCLI